MEKEIKLNGIYKHYKGNFYLTLDVAFHSETGEKMIIYKALYDDLKIWCRPYSMFLDEVNKNGQKYRFELQDIKSAV